MHAFDVLSDPVRRRILELLADGEMSAGDVTDLVRREFNITQPAVSQHLKVLRENGFAVVRPEGTRRLYSVDAGPLRETDAWLDRFRHFWTPHLDALATELARGKRERRLREESDRHGNRDCRTRHLGCAQRLPARLPDAGRQHVCSRMAPDSYLAGD